MEPPYPEQARAAKVQGTVLLELTIDREGRVADARVLKSIAPLDRSALVAARQWEFAPTIVDGTAVPVTHTVPVTFELADLTPAPTAPADQSPPRAAAAAKPPEPAVRPSSPPAAPAATPAPRPDPAAEANAVREALRRYEAAWEALDVSALGAVQRLSDGEAARVRQSMAAAQAYAMQVDVQDLQILPDGRRATAVCRVARRFTPRVGRATDQNGVSTFTLETQGDNWVIVSIR